MKSRVHFRATRFPWICPVCTRMGKKMDPRLRELAPWTEAARMQPGAHLSDHPRPHTHMYILHEYRKICGVGCVKCVRARARVTQPSPRIFLHICMSNCSARLVFLNANHAAFTLAPRQRALLTVICGLHLADSQRSQRLIRCA